MKNLLITIICCCSLFQLSAQFNTVFSSTSTHHEGVYDVSTDCSSSEGLFLGLRFDVIGNGSDDVKRIVLGSFNKSTGVIDNPVFTYPNASSPISSFAIKSDNLHIQSIRDANGVCEGYIIILSVIAPTSSDYDLNLIRLDTNGNLVYSLLLYENNGRSERCHGFIQDSNGQIVFTGRSGDMQGNDILIGKFDLNTFTIEDKRYPIDLDGDGVSEFSEAKDIIEVSGTNTAAKYAIAGRSGIFPLLMLVDNNLNHVNNQFYDFDNDPNTWERAEALEFDGSNFWITGVRTNGNFDQSTFVLNMNGIEGFVPMFDLNWQKDFIIPGSENYPNDMELNILNNSVIIAGISELNAPVSGNQNTDAFLMEISAGNVNWAYNHNYANLEGILFGLKKDGNNFFLGGGGYEDSTDPELKLQIVSTDLDGLGNEGCYEDLDVEVVDLNTEPFNYPPETTDLESSLGELPYFFAAVDVEQESCNSCPEETDNVYFDITRRVQSNTNQELFDIATDVVQDPDGNYVYTGVTYVASTNQQKPYLIKLAPTGNVIAGPTYFDILGLSLTVPEDGPKLEVAYNGTTFIGYTVAINAQTTGNKRIVLNGFNPDFSKNCSLELNPGQAGDWIFNDFIQNENQIFIVGKYVTNSGSDMVVFKSNLPFNCSSGGSGPLFPPAYQSSIFSQIDEATAICKFADGTMGVAGSRSGGGSTNDICYANLLPTLNFKTFGSPSSNNYITFDVNQDANDDRAVSITQRADGRVLIGGTQNFGDAVFLIECDQSPITNNSYVAVLNTNNASEELMDLKIKPNGNIVLMGQTSVTTGINHPFISVLDPSYTELSYVEYGLANTTTVGLAFDICNDNGLIMAQSTRSPGCSGFCLEELDSKFTKTGPLGYLVDCDCYTPSTFNIEIHDQSRSVFLHPGTTGTIGFQSKIDISCQELEVIAEICSQGGAAELCDIQTTMQLDQDDICCTTSLSLSNNMMGAYKIQIDLVNPASLQFDQITTDPAFCVLPGSLSQGSVIIEMCNNGPLPTGNTPDYLQFCMMDSIAPSNLQDFTVTYLNANCSPILDCVDFLSTECPIDTFELDCYEIVVDEVICDTIPGLYNLCFTVKNNDVTNSLKWLDLSATSILFLDANPICLSPVIPPGGVSTQICTQIYDNSGLALPRTIKLGHAAHDSSYNYCCQDLDDICVELPNCCNPCESEWISMDDIDGGVDSCCFALDILVDCPSSLTKIITESLTPGVVFGSVYVGGSCAPGWNINSFTSNVATFTPLGGSAPLGVCNDLINFCLNDTLGTNPIQQVAVHYVVANSIGEDSIACTEILEFNCSQGPECLEIVEEYVYCDDNGDYFLDFCVKNIAFPAFTADELVINKISSTPSFLGILPNSFSGISIPPQSSFCGTVQIAGVPGLAPFPGQKIVLGFAMHETNAFGQDTCCLDTEELCVVLPPCSDCCEDFDAFCAHVQPNTVIYGICDSAYVSIGYADDCTYSDIDWGDGTTESHIGTFATTHYYNSPGTYTICTDYKESTDNGASFCWNKVVCNTIEIEGCDSVATICEEVVFDSLSYLGWAAATCYSGANFQTSPNPQGYVCGIIDISNHPSAPNGSNWTPTMYHGTGANEWTGTNIGEVFGLAVDPKGNIYTSSASFYRNLGVGAYVNASFGSSTFNPSGMPSIYKLDPFTSAITNLNASLPQSPDPNYSNQYPGFGNLCYNFKNDLVYVSNLEDGIIYALDANSGSIRYQFDHGTMDISPGFAPLGDRIFGIGYNHIENNIYYSLWRLDENNRLAGTYNEVWSIQLDSNGDFVGLPNKEFDIPYLDNNFRQYSNPVTDISFDATGQKMLISERTITSNNNFIGTSAHKSRTLEFISNNTAPPFSNNYVMEPINKFDSLNGTNASGGNDYAYSDSSFINCDSFVVMTEDAILLNAPANVYGLRGTPNSGGINPNWMVDLDADLIGQDKTLIGDVEVYRNLCCETPPVMPDTCDFTFETECFKLTFSGSGGNGMPPFTYNWDIDCDGVIDITGQNPVWTFPSLPSISTHCVEMIVTDAGGQACIIQKQVTVQDLTAPVINCPGDITLTTEPGSCFATFMMPSVSDNCDPNPSFSCSITGATTGNQNTVQFNKGVTNITCIAEDASSNTSTCTFKITVVDNEPPSISCSPDIQRSIQLCDGGISIVLPAPTFADNCPMASVTCSHQSGDFFTCGTTTVTCTATDMAGNTSTCSYDVIVNCECIETVLGDLTCTDVDNEYDFTISIYDISGANGNCTGFVSTSQAGVTILSQSSTNNANPIVVTGKIQLSTTPIPTNISLIATMLCVCPNGNNIECSQDISLDVPCCKEISVDPQEVCKNASIISVPLIGCNNLFDVQQVRWYISDAPCPPQGSYGAPFQVTNNCSPLILEPKYHNADICVYAEVDLGPQAGPCSTITSNTAIITLCEPVGCSVNNEEHCYSGTPITPSLLTASLNPTTPNCPYTAVWFDSNNTMIGTGLTYQPPALSLPAGSQSCSESFSYRCEITSVCGVSNCVSTITLHNDNAPLGNLFLNPNEPMPFCPGEDAALQYDKACAGSPAEWDWFRSNDNFVIDITPLPSNGKMNDNYLTNRLYQDTWIRVEKQNGTCPVDQIDFFIDVTDILTINSFTANASPLCAPTQVDLDIDWTPDYTPASGCDFTIEWYRNGALIQSTVQNTSPASLTYTGTDLHGNYFAIIRDNCCGQTAKSNTVSIDPPMEVVIVGPCFRCNCDTVALTAVVKNEYAGCSYQWYKEGVLIPGETGKTLTITSLLATTSPPFINYSFKIDCPNGCVDTQAYQLRQCGDCETNAVDDIERISATLYPNPTANQVTIEFGVPIGANTYIEIVDITGKRMTYQPISKGSLQIEENLSGFIPGLYIINIMKDGYPIYTEKIIKE